MPKANTISFVFWTVVLPIIIGGLCYIFFKPSNTLLHNYVQKVIALPTVKQQYIVANYIPDFCWAFSLSNALLLIYKPKKTNYYYWLCVITAFLATETVQLLVPKIFTFDWYDILVLVFAAFCSYLLSLHYGKEN